MPLSTWCGTGEGLAGEGFLGGDWAFGTQLVLQPQRHISILLCLPASISAVEAQRCCSSICRQCPAQLKLGRWFHPWESDLESSLCPEERCGDWDPKVDSHPVCFKMGKQSRPLKFRLLSPKISQLQITYLIPEPIQPLLAPAWSCAVPAQGITQQILMERFWVSTAPMSHSHTLRPEPGSKVKCRPKYCLFPATSELHPS